MSHIKINNQLLSWDNIYKICGLTEEDFMYDPEGSYNDLVEAYSNYEDEGEEE